MEKLIKTKKAEVHFIKSQKENALKICDKIN